MPISELGTVDHADLQLEEQPAPVLDAEQDVESASGVRVRVVVHDVQRGAAAGVDVPRGLHPEVVRELEVEADEREVVTDADLHVGPEPQVFHEV